MFYNLAAPSWGEEELDAIKDVSSSGYFTMSANVSSFESAFAKYHDLPFGVMVNSGSSANLISVASLFFKKDNPLKRGDEVIVPAVSWATTYYPLQQYGLKLKILDIDLETLNIDITRLEEALTPKTKMIVAVSILGNPAPLDIIKDFADAKGLYFMEDNCESLDAELGGKKAGSFGDLSTFSFFFSHHISTMEGGMVLTKNRELYNLLLSLRAHGWTRDLPPESPIFDARNDDFYEAYRFILPGYNVRPLEFAGAIGLQQLKKLPDMTKIRRKNLSMFQTLMGKNENFIIQRENGKSSSFSFPIIVHPQKNICRDRVFEGLKKAQIGYRIITGGNILRHDVSCFFDYETVGKLENANTAHDFGFFVGNHPTDLSPQLARLAEVLEDVTR